MGATSGEVSAGAYPCAIACEWVFHAPMKPTRTAFRRALRWCRRIQGASGGEVLILTHWPAMFGNYWPVLDGLGRRGRYRLAAHKEGRDLADWAGGPVLALHLGEQALIEIADDPRTTALCVVYSDDAVSRAIVSKWKPRTEPRRLTRIRSAKTPPHSS